MELKILVKINKELYEKTVIAIKKACQHFGLKEPVTIHVYRSNVNYKIPKDDLHQALKLGGASTVETDSREFNLRSGSNDNQLRVRVNTNLHVARIFP